MKRIFIDSRGIECSFRETDSDNKWTVSPEHPKKQITREKKEQLRQESYDKLNVCPKCHCILPTNGKCDCGYKATIIGSNGHSTHTAQLQRDYIKLQKERYDYYQEAMSAKNELDKAIALHELAKLNK